MGVSEVRNVRKDAICVLSVFLFTLLITDQVDAATVTLFKGTDTIFKEQGLRFDSKPAPGAIKTFDFSDFNYRSGSCPSVIGAICMEFSSMYGLYLANKPADSLLNEKLNLNDTTMFKSGLDSVRRNDPKFAFHDGDMKALSYDTYEKNAMICKTVDSNYVLLSIKHFGGNATYEYTTVSEPDGTTRLIPYRSYTQDTLVVSWILQTNKTADFRGKTGIIIQPAEKNIRKYNRSAQQRYFSINGKEIKKSSITSGMIKSYIVFNNLTGVYNIKTNCLK
jgi:hypothetical protein